MQFFGIVITNFTLVRFEHFFKKLYIKSGNNIDKISTKSNKIELSEEFMVMWKEDRPPELFCKKRVHRNFAKFTRKHLSQSLFFNKVAGLAKFLRTLFLTEHLWVTASKV